jgi:hypothetical protein
MEAYWECLGPVFVVSLDKLFTLCSEINKKLSGREESDTLPSTYHPLLGVSPTV